MTTDGIVFMGTQWSVNEERLCIRHINFTPSMRVTTVAKFAQARLSSEFTGRTKKSELLNIWPKNRGKLMSHPQIHLDGIRPTSFNRDAQMRSRPRWFRPASIAGARSPLKLSFARKTFFLILLQTLIIIFGFSLSINWAFDKGTTEYMAQFDEARAREMVQLLTKEYKVNGDFQALRGSQTKWINMAMQAAGHNVGSTPTEITKLDTMFAVFRENDFPSAFPAPLPLRFVLFDPQGQFLAGNPRANKNLIRTPVVVDGHIIGILGFSPSPISNYDQRVRQRYLAALAATIFGSSLLAVMLAILIARQVTQPVRAIGEAARRLAEGKIHRPLEIRSDDELGELCRDFNSLSEALSKHDTLQTLWLAEISHELRTPVSALVASTEAILDNVRPMDRKALQALHGEGLRLSRLISDLHQLSQTDFGAVTYNFSHIDVSELLEHCKFLMDAKFESKKISFHTKKDIKNCIITADKDKLSQIFINLLENTYQYTDFGGKLVIKISRAGENIAINFEDTSPSVREEDFPHLFDRLYRAEGSRSREGGGTGLGLAIVRAISEAHGGSVSAYPSKLGGIRVELLLPRKRT